jgi:hypothetical protein
MSDAALPILAYATPQAVERPDSTPGELTLTFAPPPVEQQVRLNFAAVALCFVAVCILIAGIVVAITQQRKPDVGAAFPLAMCLLMVIAIAIDRFREMRRLKRFGHLPIVLELDDGLLTLIEPMRDRGRPSRWILARAVRRCTYHRRNVSLTGPQLYVVQVWFSRTAAFRVCVACDDAGVVARAMSDLELAIRGGHIRR